MNKTMVLALIRHLMTFGGGFLVTRGVLDAGTVEAVSGAVLTLVGVGLSFWDKKQLGA